MAITITSNPALPLLPVVFWGPSSPDLKRIRQELAADAQPFRDIIADPTFIKTFGSLQGDQVKNSATRLLKGITPILICCAISNFLVLRKIHRQASAIRQLPEQSHRDLSGHAPHVSIT